jgi:outer membrane murein-binding lipoprotein Lpp
MKEHKLWVIIGVAALLFAVLALPGCVSKSDYETLRSEYETLRADYRVLQADYEALKADYDALKQQLAITPQIDKPSFSKDEVLAIVGNHFSDIFYEPAKPEDFEYGESSHWEAWYLGDGKWEVRCVLTNTVGIWYFYEKTQTVQFWGRVAR